MYHPPRAGQTLNFPICRRLKNAIKITTVWGFARIRLSLEKAETIYERAPYILSNWHSCHVINYLRGVYHFCYWNDKRKEAYPLLVLFTLPLPLQANKLCFFPTWRLSREYFILGRLSVSANAGEIILNVGYKIIAIYVQFMHTHCAWQTMLIWIMLFSFVEILTFVEVLHNQLRMMVNKSTAMNIEIPCQ